LDINNFHDITERGELLSKAKKDLHLLLHIIWY